jgi:hypothetical protein
MIALEPFLQTDIIHTRDLVMLSTVGSIQRQQRYSTSYLLLVRRMTISIRARHWQFAQ